MVLPVREERTPLENAIEGLADNMFLRGATLEFYIAGDDEIQIITRNYQQLRVQGLPQEYPLTYSKIVHLSKQIRDDYLAEGRSDDAVYIVE